MTRIEMKLMKGNSNYGSVNEADIFNSFENGSILGARLWNYSPAKIID
jgi:hypothetical protein